MSSSKPSIREVAALARVSTATVSNVFSGRKPVNDDLKQRVLRAAEGLGYQIDPVASQLRSGRARIVAVLVPDLTDTFFATIVSRLETMASDEGYDVIVASSHDNPSVEVVALEGAPFVAARGTDPHAVLGRAARGSFCSRRRYAHRSRRPRRRRRRDHGHGDDRQCRSGGNRRTPPRSKPGTDDIVIAVSSLSYAPIRERAEGASALIASQLGKPPTMIELGSDAAEGARIFADLIDRDGPPGAVIALTNVTTLSVLSALAEHHVSIPEGTSIVAFDDYPWMAARNTGLTAIRQPVDEIAATAWNRLRLRLANEGGAGVEPTVLRANLIVRGSVKDLTGVAPPARSRRGAERSGRTVAAPDSGRARDARRRHGPRGEEEETTTEQARRGDA